MADLDDSCSIYRLYKLLFLDIKRLAEAKQVIGSLMARPYDFQDGMVVNSNYAGGVIGDILWSGTRNLGWAADWG